MNLNVYGRESMLQAKLCLIIIKTLFLRTTSGGIEQGFMSIKPRPGNAAVLYSYILGLDG
jgi:hypothetical protein